MCIPTPRSCRHGFFPLNQQLLPQLEPFEECQGSPADLFKGKTEQEISIPAAAPSLMSSILVILDVLNLFTGIKSTGFISVF